MQRLGTRVAFTTASFVPPDAAQARDADIAGFKDAQKIFMANRGIFDFGWWGRPSLCVAHTSSDVDACVGRFGEWLTAATG